MTTRLAGRKSRGADSCTDGGDKLRCHSQVECPDDIPTGQHVRKLCPAIFREGIDLYVHAHGAEGFGLLGCLVAIGDVPLDARGHLGSIVVGGDSGDAGGDDAAARWNLAVAEPVIQRGQQLPVGEVASAAEHDVVEGFDRDDARRHFASPPIGRPT